MNTFILLLTIFTIIFLINNHNYKKTTYYKDTHNSYLATLLDKGRYGEFLTYRELRNYESAGGKFLFNCYLPKDNGETTEVDVILINDHGIFVFESKNYSGWIFGNEKSKTWTQTLPQGKGKSHKEHFLNPIMQNKLHIKWLKSILGEDIAVHSIIVFSERCTLKKIECTSPNIYVIKRNTINHLINKICSSQLKVLTEAEIANIYTTLYPYTQVEDSTKDKHIADIKEKTNISKAAIEPIDNPQKITAFSKPPIPANDNTQADTPVNRICPKCNSPLVLRTTKKGAHAGEQFYGCSRFPKCRYHENL